MTKRHQRQADGLYHIGGKKYKILTAKRAQVWHGTAYQNTWWINKGRSSQKQTWSYCI